MKKDIDNLKKKLHMKINIIKKIKIIPCLTMNLMQIFDKESAGDEKKNHGIFLFYEYAPKKS